MKKTALFTFSLLVLFASMSLHLAAQGSQNASEDSTRQSSADYIKPSKGIAFNFTYQFLDLAKDNSTGCNLTVSNSYFDFLHYSFTVGFFEHSKIEYDYSFSKYEYDPYNYVFAGYGYTKYDSQALYCRANVGTNLAFTDRIVLTTFISAGVFDNYSSLEMEYNQQETSSEYNFTYLLAAGLRGNFRVYDNLFLTASAEFTIFPGVYGNPHSALKDEYDSEWLKGNIFIGVGAGYLLAL